MKKTTIFIGGYTQGNNSRGIYKTSFDLETGKFGTPSLLKSANNPSFLALSVNKKTLYSLEELCNKTGGGKLHSISLDKASEFSSSITSFGEHPCYIGISKSLALCANYSSGSLSAYSLLANGQICTTENSTLKLHGNGPNTKRQESSHAHFFEFINGSLFSVDLGSDTICEFENLTSSGANLFNHCKKQEFKTPPGYGPRHICSNPFSKNEIWVSCELESKILCYRKESNKWSLTLELNTIDSKSQNTMEKDGITNYPSHLTFNPSNESLYVSNRGHDSISVFQKKDDHWQQTQNFPSNGSFPRHFALSSCGYFLIIANQLENNLSCLRLDKNGLIVEITDSIEHPSPTCILPS